MNGVAVSTEVTFHCRYSKLLPSYAGFVFANEVEHLSKHFSGASDACSSRRAKFETKTPHSFCRLNDIFTCGALANDIYCARGYETGVSLVSECAIGLASRKPKIRVPSDVIVRKLSGSFEKNDAVERRKMDAGRNALDDMRTR